VCLYEDSVLQAVLWVRRGLPLPHLLDFILFFQGLKLFKQLIIRLHSPFPCGDLLTSVRIQGGVVTTRVIGSAFIIHHNIMLLFYFERGFGVLGFWGLGFRV
jgi:hypothetical protein